MNYVARYNQSKEQKVQTVFSTQWEFNQPGFEPLADNLYLYLRDTRNGFLWMTAIREQVFKAALADFKKDFPSGKQIEDLAGAVAQLSAQAKDGLLAESQDHLLGQCLTAYLGQTKTWELSQAKGAKHFLVQIYPMDGALLRPASIASDLPHPLSPLATKGYFAEVESLDRQNHPEWFLR